MLKLHLKENKNEFEQRYSTAYLDAGHSFLARKVSPSWWERMTTWVQPFTARVWGVVIAVFTATALAFYYLDEERENTWASFGKAFPYHFRAAVTTFTQLDPENVEKENWYYK